MQIFVTLYKFAALLGFGLLGFSVLVAGFLATDIIKIKRGTK